MRARNGLWLALVVAGCSSGPKYKVDDKVIASLSVEQKQGMLAAQSEQNLAREEVKKAKADYDASDREVDIASNEYKAAKLQRDTAELNKKAADQSGDMNRKNQAARDLHVAELGVKAKDAKVSWLEKKRKWFKDTLNAAEDHVAAADAKLELEKAKLVSQQGIKPSENFNIGNFESESLDKMKRYSESRHDADKRKVDVDELEYKYKALDQEYVSATSTAAH